MTTQKKADMTMSKKVTARRRETVTARRRETVTATKAALELIKQLSTIHGELMFHQSGGCCDGSAPMCYAKGELFLGDNDIKLGEIGGASFYISKDQYEAWKYPHLTIDAIDGNGGMFSLDNGTGRRFITKSEICE